MDRNLALITSKKRYLVILFRYWLVEPMFHLRIVLKQMGGKNKKKHQKAVNTEAVTFFSGNPAVETIEGKIHLFKDEGKPEEEKTEFGSLPVLFLT